MYERISIKQYLKILWQFKYPLMIASVVITGLVMLLAYNIYAGIYVDNLFFELVFVACTIHLLHALWKIKAKLYELHINIMGLHTCRVLKQRLEDTMEEAVGYLEKAQESRTKNQ